MDKKKQTVLTFWFVLLIHVSPFTVGKLITNFNSEPLQYSCVHFQTHFCSNAVIDQICQRSICLCDSCVF